MTIHPLYQKIYVDLDGVLANFDSSLARIAGVSEDLLKTQRSSKLEYDDYVWELARQEADFYLNLEFMNQEIWDAVKDLNPTILTAVPKPHRNMSKAGPQKVAWVHKNLGPTVPVIVCQREQKQIYAGNGKILIDDRESNIKDWKKNGGVGILHTEVENTLIEIAYNVSLSNQL